LPLLLGAIMAISVTWDGTTYSIPQSGEINWPSLTNFLVALGNKAAVADEMKQSIRKATVSPVTISDTADFAVVTDLTVPGPVSVTLPLGVNGRIFAIVDGKADAATNNITISSVGSETIKGQATLVMNKDRQVVWLQYNAGDSDWKLINYMIPPGQVRDADISGTISTAGKVSGSAITSGTIGGTTAINTSGNIVTSGQAILTGGVTLGNESADGLVINSGSVDIPNNLSFDFGTLYIDAANNRVGVGSGSPTVELDVAGTVKGTTVQGATVNAGALNASGNTALGDASSDVLTINGTAVTLPNGLNFDSNTLVIDAANNRVGVGIAAPTVALDVVGAAKVSTDLTVNGNTVLGDATSDTLTIAGNATQNGTGSFKVASGTTAERPGTPVNGMIRYNSDLTAFEGYAAGAWSGIGGGGSVDKINQASHGFVVGNVLYLNGATYTKAIATSAAAAEVVGVVSRVVDANNFELTLSGEISGLTGLTAGSVYFLSDSVAGTYSLTEPSTIGYVSVPVGVASSTTTFYVAPKRGVVVGGANARTQISLLNNTPNQTVQDVSSYDAGGLAGWVYIDATTDLRFYVQAQFVRGGDNIYDISYQVSGDTPPAGFLMSITNAGVIQITMPNIPGVFTSASINYALNAPAVGTNFPLSVSGSSVIGGTPTVDTINANTSGNGVQIQGRTSGVVIPSGYVGEQLSVTGSELTTSTTGGVTLTLATLPITSAGLWRVDFYVWNIEAAGVNAGAIFMANAKYNDSTFTPTIATNGDNSGVVAFVTQGAAIRGGSASSIPGLVLATDGTKSVTLRQAITLSSGTAAARGKIVATRIA
jgi:hypothetical protein